MNMSFMEKIKQIVNVDEDNYYDNDLSLIHI